MDQSRPEMIVLPLKLMNYFVQCCSRCSPDVFLWMQMLLYCYSIFICYVNYCTSVADVFIFKNLCV